MTMDVMMPLDSDNQIEICPETMSLDAVSTKNIKIKGYLCVKHVMPKSSLSHVILNENISQDRDLERTILDLSTDQIKTKNANDIIQRTFIAEQDRKQKKWKKNDDMRLFSMNLPMIHPPTQESERPRSMDIMYRSPDYRVLKPEERPSTTSKFPRMPFSTRREQTEIILQNHKMFLTKLPETEVVDKEALQHYDYYRGKRYLDTGFPTSDARFRKLENLLKPAFLKESDQFHEENLISSSRLSKYHHNTLGVAATEEGTSIRLDTPKSVPPSRQKPDNKWIITRMPTTLSDARPTTVPIPPPQPREKNVQQASQQEVAKRRMRKSLQILQTFKHGNVNKLSKSLTKERKERDKGDVTKTHCVQKLNTFFGTKQLQ